MLISNALPAISIQFAGKKKIAVLVGRALFWVISKEISEKQVLTYENSHK